MDYKNKYLKYKNKYLEQKGGTSDARIEDNRHILGKKFSFSRAHNSTDIVLQIGQKYVFQKIDLEEIDQQLEGNLSDDLIIPPNYFPSFNFKFEELEYLGQKKIRVIEHRDTPLDKRRPRELMEQIMIEDRFINFRQLHAFKRLDDTGEVLMLNDIQVLDTICL